MLTLFVERCMNPAPVKRDWPSENMPLNQRQVVSDKAVSEVIAGFPSEPTAGRFWPGRLALKPLLLARPRAD